ncbi:MAG: tail fiber domain-containing protein, partial [Catenulispora sp.]|nr:tail fiber domain-containing protein [Catenulispora sp.]
LLVSITGTEALLTGVVKTALTGRRIEIGAAGAVGEIDFIAADGTKTFMRAWTEASGIEAIQFGVAGTGGNVNLPNTLWNRINYNNDSGGGGGVGYASYRANKHEFIYGKTTGFFHVLESGDDIGGSAFERFFISKDTVSAHTNLFLIYEDDGTQRFQVGGPNGDAIFRYGDGDTALWIDNNAGKIRFYPNDAGEFIEIGPRDTAEISPIMKWLTVANPTDGLLRGAGIKYVYNSTTLTDGRLEVRNVVDNNFDRIFASAFVVSSDESTKTDIRDLGPGALDKVRALRARRYEMRSAEVKGERIGLIAQEAQAAAPELVVDGGGSGLLIDLYAQATLNGAGIGELAALVDRLAGRVAALEGKPK